MKTIFETSVGDYDFYVEKDNDEDIHFCTLTTFQEYPYCSFEFFLEKKEALNLANHILKLYSING